MMSTAPDPARGARDEGYYTATNLSNRLQLGYDWFAVREAGAGLVVESRHTLYGVPWPPQEARFELDADWTPRHFEVRAGDLFSARVEFGEAETVMTVREGSAEQTVRAPAGRRQVLFLLSGGLYYPLHAVRRFDGGNAPTRRFALFPTGVCEVSREADVEEGGRPLRQLLMRVYAGGAEDELRLFVNEHGDLTRYSVRNQNLLVQLEERGPSC